jgi:hypothetical protein
MRGSCKDTFRRPGLARNCAQGAGTHNPWPSLLQNASTTRLKRESSPYGSRRGGRDDVSGFFGIKWSNIVIASVAKQSRGRTEELDCFVARAPRNDVDGSRHSLMFSRHTAPEFCKFIGPQKKRGRREDRVRAAPAVSCAKVANKNAHEHTGSAETLRPSLRNGFTAYSVLSPVRPELFCHRHRADTSAPLDTCHWGARTTRLRRPRHALFVKSASASIAPRPNVSDDGQRPLSRDGMATIRS